jgi:hypothetical protein
MVKKIQYLLSNEKDFQEWASSKNIFFVLAIGRSGTKFLADLLANAEGAYVVHEPVKEDFQAYQDAFHNNAKARNYIERFRKKEIYLRARGKQIDTYGEVNSVLRRHYNALSEAFPQANFIHLIRDGREVIRSMMSRKTMTSEDLNTRLIHPKKGDSWRKQWPTMTRFEKLCWYWRAENYYLRNSIRYTVQFEKLISSYNYFKEKLLDVLQLSIKEDVWQAAINIPKNATIQYQFQHWSNWDAKQREAFEKICGTEMKENGYTL